MSRRALVIIGSCILALGALVALSGGALLVAFGGPDGLRTSPRPVSTSTRALVTSVAEIDHAGSTGSRLGQASVDVRVAPRDAVRGVFVGIAPAATVDRYLAGVDVDVVTDLELSPFGLTTEHRPGTAAVAAPGAQDFWVARAEAGTGTGTGTAQLTWTIREGDYRMVLMNADGSAVVDMDAGFGITVPGARPIGVALLAGGLVLVLAGAVVLVLGLRTPPRPRTPGSPIGPDRRETLPTGPTQW